MSVIHCAEIKKTPINKYDYFPYSTIFLTEFAVVILDTI